MFGHMCKQYPSVVDQLVRRHLEEYRGNLDAELGSLCAVGVVANGLMSDVTESPIHDMAQRAIRHLFARAAHDGAPDSCACTVIWSLVSRPKAGSEKKGTTTAVEPKALDALLLQRPAIEYCLLQ